MDQSCCDYISHLRDEIALEGLDGITLEALWLRLSLRHNFTNFLPLDENSKKMLWTLIIYDEEMTFYKLEKPRSNLQIFNRYEYIDDEMGMILEPKDNFEDIYPCCEVEDEKSGIRGSCSTYKTRVDITEIVNSLSLVQVKKEYGNTLVIVASQMLRNKALSINTAIDQFYNLTLIQYIMLERIGRSRNMGEITYGKNSLACLKCDAKTMYYHRKRLLKLKIITKQDHQQRTVKGSISSSSLLHLTRFTVQRKSKFVHIIQQVIDILKEKPKYLHPLSLVKAQIGFTEVSSKKIFKNSEFLKYIRTVILPYRQVYENATEAEWRYKVKDEEKSVRCLQLINPHLDSDNVCSSKEETEFGEDGEDDSLGILDQSKILLGISTIQQAYMAVEGAGPNGMSQIELAKYLGQTKLDSRTICRNLLKRNVIHSLMKDIGRQRVTRFVSNKFISTGHLLQEFETERKKMIKIVESTNYDVEKEYYETNTQELSNSRLMEADPCEDDDDVVITLKVKYKFSEQSYTWNDEINEKMEIKVANGKTKKESPHKTTKDLKRGIMLMNEVKNHKIVDDTVKLQKLITETEAKEGLDGKMDKKSLWRLMKRMSDIGNIKIIDVSMVCGNRKKSCTFITDNKVTIGSQILKKYIEKHKHKFLVHAVTSFRKDNGESSQLPSSTLDSSFGDSPLKLGKDNPNVKASTLEHKQKQDVPNNTKLLGKLDSKPFQKLVFVKGQVSPKFKKIREFHKLLFYLVYEYEGNANLNQREGWQNIIKTSSENISLEEVDNYSRIYYDKLDFRMFISPLPRHIPDSNEADKMDGWAFIFEVILRIPLSIYVQMQSLSYSIAELDSYLNHPIKRHTLIKDLPAELRKFLLDKRRHVTYIIELCHRLCYMGLAQQGTQISVEKDQTWLYLNRRAITVDTTTSKPGYHHISMENEYVRKLYFFETLAVIDEYWCDLETICMHTSLGGRSCVEGTKITMMTLEKKRSMIDCLKVRGTRDAQLNDIGFIPGDGKGAAGLDSAMFAHLKRNWSINGKTSQSIAVSSKTEPGKYSDGEKMHSYAQYLKDSCQPNSPETSSAKRLPGIRNVRLSLYKPSKKEPVEEPASPVAIFVEIVDTKTRQKKSIGKSTPKASTTVSNRKGRRRESYEREVKVREKRPRKPYHDEKDKAALRRMNKLRVEWYPAEDSVLLACKVASLYLFPNKRLQVVNFSVVRDILHSRFPESRNKTSKACQRRILYMMKNPKTEENVAIILEELKQDPELCSEFKPQKIPLNPSVIIENYSLMFKELVNQLILKLESNKSQIIPELPTTLQEFDKRFKIIRTSSSIKLDSKLGEIKTTRDIDHYVVHALLFSSLCTMQDRESWAYQLYLAYQKYPQSLLNSVLTFIRDSKMISYKKTCNRSTYNRQCLPLNVSPFQLSLSFVYTFHMKHHYDIFGQCWDLVKQLLRAKQNMMTDIENEWKSSNRSTSEIHPKEKKIKKSIRNKKAIKKEPSEYSESDNVGNKEGFETYEEHVRDHLQKRLLDEKGVEIVIHQEGGFCAAVTSLMATKRVLFDIIIPEQIIMIDKNQCDKEGRQKLMQKILYHEEVSGRKFELPPELQHKEKDDSPADEDIYLDCRPVNASVSCVKTLNASQVENDKPRIQNNNMSNFHQENFQRKICKVEDGKLKNKVSFDIGDNLDDFNNSRNADDSSLHENDIDDSDFDQPLDLSNIEAANDPLNIDSDAERTHLTDCENDSFKRKHQEDFIVNKRHKLLKEINSEDVTDNVAVTVDSGLTGTENTSNVKVSRSKQHSRSRLNMYMMREQLVNQYESSNYPQWEKDNVLINACEVSCRLRLPPDTEHCKILPSSIDEMSKVFLPLSKDKIEEALIKRKRVILSDWIKYDTALEIWTARGESAEYLMLASKIYSLIDSLKEFGASALDIKSLFNEEIISINPMKIVNDMENLKLILKVGIETWKWVTIHHSKIWLIHTNKISRNKMKSMEAIRNIGVYEINVHNNETEIGTENKPTDKNIDSTNILEDYSLPLRGTKRTRSKRGSEEAAREKPLVEILPNKEVKDFEGECDKTCNKEIRSVVTRHNVRSRLALRNQKYRKESTLMANVEKSIESQIALHEEIDVFVRPWVRLNGCLNRRVMDQFLGSVLSYVMETPGTNGKSITDRFWPALQPAHTYELLETLEDIECVTRTNVVKSNVVTLFSKPQIIEEEPVETFDFDENFSYHPTVDAILKLSMFIGDKKYCQDFITTCRKK